MPVTNREELRDILTTSKVIAVVGYSNSPMKPSYQIGQMLKRVGYTVYPVNPTLDEIDGEKCYHTLDEVPEPIDIVDVFRRPEYLVGVVEDAIRVQAKCVWAQLGIANNAAAEKAEAAGLKMVMDNCIKVTYYQLVSR